MEARKRSCPSILEALKKSRPSILMKNTDLKITGSNLPDDVIFEILSRLPVKSVLRFKCVCNSWLMITHQKFFIDKHRSRSQIVYKYENVYEDINKESYCHGDTLHGLVLETSFKTRLHRIRNPATKQVLQVTSQVFERSFKYIIGFDPSTSMYNLVNFYRKEDTNNLGVRMLTIGGDNDLHAWRYLKDINLMWVKSRRPRHIYHKDVSYSAIYSYTELEKTDILRLSMDGKSSMNIKVPQSFQTVPGIRSYNMLQMFILGDEKLSLGFIIGHNLHVWVLENYEKHIWSEKKIIPLDFIKYLPGPCKILVQPSPNLGKLRVSFNNLYVEYDVHSQNIICTLAELPRGEQFWYDITPSLVSLKGMRSEDP